MISTTKRCLIILFVINYIHKTIHHKITQCVRDVVVSNIENGGGKCLCYQIRKYYCILVKDHWSSLGWSCILKQNIGYCDTWEVKEVQQTGFLTMTFLQWFDDIIDHANLLTSFCGSKYLPKIWLNKMMISVFSLIRAIQMFWLNKYIFAIYRRLENTSTYIFRKFFTHRMFIY